MNEPESISFQGRLTPQDFRGIQAVALRPVSWVFTGCMVLLAITLINPGHVPWRDRNALSIALHWLPLPVPFLLFLWMRRILFRRGWLQNKLIQQSFRGSVSEAGIDWRSDVSQMNLPWDVLHKVKLCDGLVLVYSSPLQAFPFPRSFFASDEDWRRFRALVERKLSRSRR